MYENNNNYNQQYYGGSPDNSNSSDSQYYYSTAYNGGYNGQTPPPPKPPKKKKVSGAIISGLLIGALVFGGIGGFGASFLTNRISSSITDSNNNGDSEKDPENSGSSDEDKENGDSTTQAPHIPPENPIENDLSGLSNMAALNTSTKYDYEELFKAVNESIVIINNYVKNEYSGEEYTLSGMGSGIIFTTDGYIVTNAHVVDGAAKLTVVVDDKYGSKDDEIEANLIGSDQATDLAVLKISRDKPYTAVPLGNSDKLNIGQQVCAIGNPAGLSKTLTGGYISGLNRYTSDKGYVLSSIQTDAAINPGNSGGGLFDMYGNVIGIVNSKIVASDSSIENLGFAITINEAKPIISDLINYGFVKGRPMLGIVTKKLSEYTYGTSGLLVVEIDSDAPVSKSELKVNDIIIAVNGEAVADVEDVQKITKGMKAGDTITVKVLRPVKRGSGYYSQTTFEEHEFDIILTENS